MSSPSSSSQARTEPPSESRVHEARSHGHSARAELAAPAAAFVVLALWLIGFARDLTQRLQRVLSQPLSKLTHAESVPIADHAQAVLLAFGATVAFVLVGCLLAMVVLRSLAQGGFFFSLRALAPRKRYGKIAGTRSVMAPIAVLGFGVIFAASLAQTLRAESATLLSLLMTVGFRMATLLVLLALVDAALSRAAFWRSLWMTRRERNAEDREAYGSPELRAARERIRRETQASRSVT